MKPIKLKNTLESRVFFSSDLHIDHKAICKGTSKWDDLNNCRDFESLKQMNTHIINEINSVVRESDTLILLGDTLFGEKKYGEFFNKLNCKRIYVLAGNHCNINKLQHDEVHYTNFTFLGHYAEFIINGQYVNVCHYPIVSFNNMNKGSWMCYGHVHGSIQKSRDDVALYYNSLRTLDVGIDNAYYIFRRYIPFDFDWVSLILNTKSVKSKIDYH